MAIGHGFVAGTLVHTKIGLVPIDQLSVGDLVLSRPENDPNAPNVYKRVVRTIKSADKLPLTYVNYMVNIDGANEEDGIRYVFCSPHQPFFRNNLNYNSDLNSSTLGERLGCLAAEQMGYSDDHEAIETLHGEKVFATLYPNVDGAERLLLKQGEGFAIATTDESGSGPLFDFRQGRPIALGGGGVSMGTLSDMSYMSPEQEQIIYPPSDEDVNVQALLPMLRNGDWDTYEDFAYSIEVEDDHGYFVDKVGLWVHG